MLHSHPAKKLFAKALVDGRYPMLIEEPVAWNMSNGEFVTEKVMKIEKKALLPSLCKRQFFTLDVNVMPHDNCVCDLIIG